LVDVVRESSLQFPDADFHVVIVSWDRDHIAHGREVASVRFTLRSEAVSLGVPWLIEQDVISPRQLEHGARAKAVVLDPAREVSSPALQLRSE